MDGIPTGWSIFSTTVTSGGTCFLIKTSVVCEVEVWGSVKKIFQNVFREISEKFYGFSDKFLHLPVILRLSTTKNALVEFKSPSIYLYYSYFMVSLIFDGEFFSETVS